MPKSFDGFSDQDLFTLCSVADEMRMAAIAFGDDWRSELSSSEAKFIDMLERHEIWIAPDRAS